MPPHGPASGKDTAPECWSVASLKVWLLFVRVATLIGRAVIQKRAYCTACNHAHRRSRLVLARLPSRDLTRQGCRVRAYRDVLAACPAMVGGRGPCCQAEDHRLYKRSICIVQTLLTFHVSHDAGRARALQRRRRSAALQLNAEPVKLHRAQGRSYRVSRFVTTAHKKSPGSAGAFWFTANARLSDPDDAIQRRPVPRRIPWTARPACRPACGAPPRRTAG
ncbi:hypothetical protein LMG31886_17890 [Xanthomonas hydrangeae]|nr:hypothetical protein LMG31886_17890 [Xanthomonas hydrangeae]CAD7732791.1 hypothetical protein LMG31886_17890 [Xanthomonas hydrangeae]CAD7746754.1 hypothetical protein LMG31885_42340 [Xanthomonas hydrangeae]CAD7746756.1 hypothetical protein LMG31885_42340 [Xanthomonas hydrangeae]